VTVGAAGLGAGRAIGAGAGFGVAGFGGAAFGGAGLAGAGLAGGGVTFWLTAGGGDCREPCAWPQAEGVRIGAASRPNAAKPATAHDLDVMVNVSQTGKTKSPTFGQAAGCVGIGR
jgi:hypothetical protein